MKKTKYIGFRVSPDEWDKLTSVQKNIAKEDKRGRKPPELAEILRSIVFGVNPALVSTAERAFLAGEVDDIHGHFTPEKIAGKKSRKTG